MGMSLGRNDRPYSFRTVTTSFPSGSLSPRLVKICTTPFAAFDPYRDDAAAPFTTSTRSMSSELMSARAWRLIARRARDLVVGRRVADTARAQRYGLTLGPLGWDRQRVHARDGGGGSDV